ncbi:MAG: hypothetical protein NVV82_11695 [Sporocytophaga sp.]|nr:hypothetical protein [Sporocytophaga sp.]
MHLVRLPKRKKSNPQELAQQKEPDPFIYVIPKECGRIDLPTFISDSLYINYENYLNGLDCHKPSSIGLASNELSKLISNSDTSKVDSLFYIFSKYYDLVTDSLNSVLEYDTTDYTPFVITSEQRKAAEKALNFYNELRKNGFDFNYPEGIIEIGQDRDFISKFYNKLSKNMIEYLDQVNYENKNWFQNDAAIMITEQDFFDRLLWWEKFNNSNPSFLFAKDAQYTQKYYLYFLLHGMDNTFPFMDVGDKLIEYFKNLYELAEKYPAETDCIKIIRTQYEMIKRSEMKDSEERQEFLKELQRENKTLSFN